MVLTMKHGSVMDILMLLQDSYARYIDSALLFLCQFIYCTCGGCGGVVVSMLDFRSEGRWFKAQSLASCCFLRQETLPHIVSLNPGV